MLGDCGEDVELALEEWERIVREQFENGWLTRNQSARLGWAQRLIQGKVEV